MPRMKKTQKRSREGESSVEPPPPNHPLAKWFHSNEDLIFFELRLAGRKEIPPRYLDPNLLASQNFSHLYEILTMQESNDQDPSEFSMVFRLGRNTYKLHCSRLASIWKLPLDGCLFEGGKIPLEDWGYDKMRAMELFNLTQNEKSKIPCQPMNDEYRTLLYLVTYVLEPRISGHGNVADEDLVLMWAMVNEIKINWPYLILHHMLRIKGKDASGGIGYLCLWTRIFNYLGVDLSNENVKLLNPRSIINDATLHHMGKGKGIQEEEQAPHMAFRGHPGLSSSSHEEPSMSDLMQVLQSIEQNMDQRFQRIEYNQARMESNQQHLDQQIQSLQQEQRKIWRSIRRIEAWTFSEDEDEEQD
ncbi:hypothetical protein PIB30_071982 [Stylosanthes scabra]|uniref:Aminotransferase-like plant mobile domain-containing protein n=1 Tax=Stylosanthes scabra TaxID=79078 RepID=A0ABU6VP61_9FABA|nr:hypothetical protein [Stylosanthes scabra]